MGLGIPLYLVTMASQNLPGFAVLHNSGYRPPARAILVVTGFLSFLSAPFGAHATNLSAITASICTGEDTHPDSSQRWKVGLFYSIFYLALGLFGASIVAVFKSLPPYFISTIAGIALLSPFTQALSSATANEKNRFPAVSTFLMTCSGFSLFGVGSPFWGLMLGLIFSMLERPPNSKKFI